MNKFNAFARGLLLSFAVVGSAAAAGDDYSAITGAVSASTVVTGLLAIGAVLVLPRATRWGIRTVMSMIR